MSAITRIRLLGSWMATSIIWSAHAAGPVALDRAGRDPRPDAAQVLDQREAQHDRNRPQFAHLQRRHRLVGRHEPGQRLRVHASVAVRYRLEREVVDARQLRRRPVRQARKLAAVALRQVPLRGADLLFDQVEIVEQPFGGGRDATVGADRGREQVADFDQERFVVREPREQAVGSRDPAPGGARRRDSCRAAPSDRR